MTFELDGKKVRIFPGTPGCPEIYLNSFADEGEKIFCELHAAPCPEHSLIVVNGLNWEDDMTPWYCPPLFSDGTPCGGKAEEYGAWMKETLLPAARQQLGGKGLYAAIAGYSLAGLFAVYSLYHSDIFDRAASVSGSLWYPELLPYLASHSLSRKPSCLYFSIGATATSKECTGNADNGITISGQSESDSKNIYLVYQDAGEEEYYAMSILELPAKSSGSEVKNYGIQIDPYDPSFGEAATGYTEAPAAKTITIKNTGNAALTLALGSAEGYAASLSSTELAVDSSVTLTVQPNTGLEKGTHKASITLTASADSEQILNTSLPFTFTVSDNPTPSEGTVSFEASRSGSQNLSLTFTPTVDGTLRYIVKDKGDSAPLEADFDNANSISGTANTTTTTTISLGDNPENAKILYLRYYAKSDNHLVTGSTNMEIPAYADTTFSADVTPTEINLGNPLEGYSPAIISGTVTIKNTGAGVLSFAVDTEDSGYSDFNRYFTVNVAGAQNIASGSSGSVTVSPKAGLLEGEYTGRFYLVDKIDDTNALMLSPVTVTFKVSKKGDGTVEGVRSPEGEYTRPGRPGSNTE